MVHIRLFITDAWVDQIGMELIDSAFFKGRWMLTHVYELELDVWVLKYKIDKRFGGSDTMEFISDYQVVEYDCNTESCSLSSYQFTQKNMTLLIESSFETGEQWVMSYCIEYVDGVELQLIHGDHKYVFVRDC